MLSSTSHLRWFNLRWDYRLFWCHGCGGRVRHNRAGLLTKIEPCHIRWACGGCYMAAYRRAQG